jgi:hypothetical protein
MSTPTTTATEAEASIAALNTTVDDAVNALTSAIEAAETVVAKFGMTIVRNKAPHFILEPTAAESPRKRIRFSDDIHAAAVARPLAGAAAERAAELASSTEAASIAEAVTAAETATAAAEAAVEEAPAAIGRSLSG